MFNCLWIKHKPEPNAPLLKKCLHQSHDPFHALFLIQWVLRFFSISRGASWTGRMERSQVTTTHTHARVQNTASLEKETLPRAGRWVGAFPGSGRTWISRALCPVSTTFSEIPADGAWKRVEKPLCASSRWGRSTNHKLSGSATSKLP